MVILLHTRTREMDARFGIEFESIMAIKSLGFLEFLQLEANARLALTDSGGVQEETCILGELSRDAAGEHGEAGDV